MVNKVTSTVDETKNLAKDLATEINKPTVIALYGNLGSGKTNFVQGLAEGLGIKKRVLSPTFVFMRSYELKRRGVKKFHHVDLYRLDSEKDVEAIGLKEILEDKDSIIAVEWPEKIENLLPENTVKIKFKTLGENKRKIVIF